MKRIGLALIGLCLLAGSLATAAEKKVLLVGDAVMQAYQSEVLDLVGNKADCTFVEMPTSGKPDWQAFCQAYVYGQGYDVIHFSYGRELMVHDDGTPRAAPEDIWGIYSSLIKALQASDAFLVGCTTTPVRGKVTGYEGAVDWEYISRFKQLLGPAGIKVNDLNDYTRTRLNEMVQDHSFLPTSLGKQLMAEQVVNSLFEAFNEGQDPSRPRILMVGDSIVGGYYGATRNLFAGKATVFSGGTTYNDAHPNWKKIVDEYIKKGGARGWDVIQFNWGLHAVKFVDEQNRTLDANQPGACVQFTPERYAENLEIFVNELKRTDATLVFATTTPISEGTAGAIVYLDLAAYNEPAKEIMKRHTIAVNDLYAFALPRLTEIQIPNNVHFTAEGSAELAKQNVKIIDPLLKRKSGENK